jgi:hypothetical protein
VLFKKLNEEKVESCLSRLQQSLSKFQVRGLSPSLPTITDPVTQGLYDAILLWEMAFGIKTVHELAKDNLKVTKQGLRVAKENLEVTTWMAAQVDETHNVLKQRLHHVSTLPSREMPTKPRFFYGWDDVVDGIARRFVNEEYCHIALLGAGGMGKMFVALAAMRHVNIIRKFGDRRFWVPCGEEQSPTRFLDIYCPASELLTTPVILLAIFSSNSRPL